MKRDYLYLGLIAIICLFFLFRECRLKKQSREDVRKATQGAVSLFQDTLIKEVTKHDTVWKVNFSELTPEEIKQLDLWKELNYNQQLLLTELAKEKNLVASLQAKFTASKRDTVTQIIRIPVLKPFWLSFLDTSGGFRYSDSIYVDSTFTRRVFTPTLDFSPDVRILKTKAKGIQGEIRVYGLEEFSNMTGQNVFAFYQPTSKADLRRKKWSRFGKIAGVIGLGAGSFYLGTLTQ